MGSTFTEAGVAGAPLEGPFKGAPFEGPLKGALLVRGSHPPDIVHILADIGLSKAFEGLKMSSFKQELL